MDGLGDTRDTEDTGTPHDKRDGTGHGPLDGDGGSDGDRFGGAFVVGCTSSTEAEFLDRNVFGLPANLLSEVEKLRPGVTLFLFNSEERVFVGSFVASSNGAENIVPSAWGGQFPAQVCVVPLAVERRVPEADFKPMLQGTELGSQSFIHRLTQEQATNLSKLFEVPPQTNGDEETGARPNIGGEISGPVLGGGLAPLNITRADADAGGGEPESPSTPPVKRIDWEEFDRQVDNGVDQGFLPRLQDGGPSLAPLNITRADADAGGGGGGGGGEPESPSTPPIKKIDWDEFDRQVDNGVDQGFLPRLQDGGPSAPPDPAPPLPNSPPANKAINDGRGKERLHYGSVDAWNGVSTTVVNESAKPGGVADCSANNGSAEVSTADVRASENPANLVQVSAPVGGDHGEQTGNPVQVSAPVGGACVEQTGGSSNIAGAVLQASVPMDVAGQGSVAAPHAVRPLQHNPQDSSSGGAPPLANTNNFAFGVGAGTSDGAKQPTGSNQQQSIVVKKRRVEVQKMAPQQPARGVDVHGDPMEVDSPSIPTPTPAPAPIHAPPRFSPRIFDPMDADITPPTATPVGSRKRKAERDRTSGGISLGVMQRPKKRVKRNLAPSEIPLSQRVWHAIKVTTGFQAGDNPYKNFVHFTLSQHWRYSCARTWQIMKSLRQEAISSNRVHLFDEVVAEAEYSRYHGIMDVEHGYCPLF
ncbi:hypothetical protein BSKO_08169 [Bryopsis sp. KO-2023]|nr:hypothetical protein BSKO_08169 [Bryopsis sp. KO-2023]